MPPKRPRASQRVANGRHWARRLHRWVGISALVFAVILSISGIMLNHSTALGLNERYLQAEWLLDWYGIEAPAPTVSYRAGAQRITQLGGRLYLDAHELASGVVDASGAVAVAGLVVVAVDDRVLLASTAGELIEEIEIADAEGSVDRIGRQGRAVVLRLDHRWYRSDEEIAGFKELDQLSESEIEWSEPSPVPPEGLVALQQLYRGRGVTAERLVADFHSGRLFGRFGSLVMDAAGVALLILGISGLVLFLRRKKAS